MKLTERKSGNFTPHPETDGTVRAVIVDVTPTKVVQSQYGEREVFRLVYETEVMDEANNRRFCVWSRGYTPSINEKANFRKDLKRILGRDLTPSEREGFDPECLLGKPVQLIVQHEQSQTGDIFATISFIGPDKGSNPLKPSGTFVRAKDREQKDAPAGESAAYRKAPAAADDEGRTDWQRVKVHVGKNAGLDLGDLDEASVRALIAHWLPTHAENPKPKADDKRLAAALEEVAELLGDNEPKPF
jgi:hypothetical protein